MESSAQRLRSRRRWLRRGLLFVVLLELAYVLAFEWAARSGHLRQWINRRPEKIAISFASAHSFVPFRVRVSGFELQGQTPKIRWRVGVDRAAGWISPLALFRRTLRIPSVTATGGEFWLRQEDEDLPALEKGASANEREQRLPALAALPPLPVPRPPSTRPKWSFELPRIRASDFREVWIDGLRLRGEIDARGGFDLISGREVEVAPSRLELKALRATIGDRELGRELGGVVHARIARYPFKQERGRAALKYISGEAQLVGQLADGEILALFLRRAPWISFGSSLGALEARVVVDEGRLKPGTNVELRHPKFATEVFQFEALGDALVRFEIPPLVGAAAERSVDLTVRYEDFTVHSSGDAAPQFLGTGLSLAATTSARELGEVLDTTQVTIDLGTARIPDLAVFNSLLPASLGLTLVSGSGALSGKFDADLAANRAHGQFDAAIEGAAVRYRDLDLQGGVKVELRLPDANLETRTFDLAGTRLSLTDFRAPGVTAAGAPEAPRDGARKAEPGAPESAMAASGPADLETPAATPPDAEAGWWAHFTLAEGSLKLPPEPAASGRFEVDLRDSEPIVGLFETKKNLPNWVAKLLTVQDVRAGGTFAWSRVWTTLDELETTFRGATIRGRIRFGPEVRKGAMMVEWHHLAVGLRVDAARKDWKFAGVRGWYDKSGFGAPLAVEKADDPLAEAALAQAELSGGLDLTAVELPPSELAYEVVPGTPVSGQLDHDRGPEAVAVIALPSVAETKSLRLVAVDLVGGRAVLIGSTELAPGTEVSALAIEHHAVVAQLRVAAGAGIAPAAETLSWKPRAGKTVEPVIRRNAS